VEENREIILRKRLKALTWLFIIGLVLSGATAIPLKWESDVLANFSNAEWISRVHTALTRTSAQFPFLFYGTDWLAFGHFVIAIAFVGALRDPVRNRWLYTFGIIACALIVPYAFIFGAIREIPLWWRLVDCSFGVFGFIPVWLCKRWAEELEIAGQQNTLQSSTSPSIEQPKSPRSTTPIPGRRAARF
jgi:hypothetical protein